MEPVRVLNMTRLFDKEMLIYSFADIRLKKPARVVWILYFLLLVLVWTVPLTKILPFNPYILFIELIVPIGGASLMSKPIWGGKKFFDFMKTQFKYIFQPKVYYDCNAGTKLKSYNINHNYQVSRRREYYELYLLEQRRRRANAK